MAKRWTPEEDALLLKLRGEGLTAREIAQQVSGRTHAAIRTRLATIAEDNKNRSWTEEEKALLLEMKADGKTNKQIARALQRTQSAVASFVFRHWNNASKPRLDG